MRLSPLLLALPISLVAGFVNAAPATPEGAAALTTTFQTYLGSVAGVVSVQPEGEVYGVKLDFSPLLLKLPGEGVEASVSPIEFKLTDNGDGTWAMTEDQAFDFSMKVPNQLEISMHISHLVSSGTFDANLKSFTQSTTELSDLTLNETYLDAALGMTTVGYHIATMHYDSTGAANPTAGVDVKANYQLTDLSETFNIPATAEGAPATEITAKATGYDAKADITGLRPDGIYKLIAFFVANPSEAAINAKWGDLTTLTGEAIPLFDHMQTKDKMTSLTVAIPQIGDVTLAEMGIEIEANGIVADGLVREAFTLTGLTLPEGLVPEWAKGLVPHSLGLDFKVAGFDLAGPARKLLEFSGVAGAAGITEAQNAELLAALLPTGAVDISLAPGTLTAPIYTLTYEGGMSAGPGAAPKGKATVSLTGLAAIRDAVKAAPEEMGMQAAPVLGMAEGIAKPGENGALVWELELTEAGGMLVNGTDLSKLGGQ